MALLVNHQDRSGPSKVESVDNLFHHISACSVASLENSFGPSLLLAGRPMSYSLALSSKMRNKLMHILHGNHGSFTLHLSNMNGLQKEGRWEFITENMVDYMAITETHATAYVQKALDKRISGSNYGIIWGHPLADIFFSGVAFVYKMSSFWVVRAIPFLDPECERFYTRMGDSWRYNFSGLTKKCLSSFTFYMEYLVPDGKLVNVNMSKNLLRRPTVILCSGALCPL